MSTRIASRLSEWSLAADAELARDLEQLSGKSIKIDDLTWARRLFATVLDSPGGLQVQTIHGFCQSILRRFPLEAGLSPQFDVLDERTAKERMRTARDAVISASKKNQLSSILESLNEISERASERTVSELIDDLLSERSKLITLYALCGFANFSSVGILVSGISAMAPERKNDLIKVSIKALIGATLASCMTGLVIGIF